MNSIAAFTFDEGGGVEKRIKKAKTTIKKHLFIGKTETRDSFPPNALSIKPNNILSSHYIVSKLYWPKAKKLIYLELSASPNASELPNDPEFRVCILLAPLH